MKTAETALSSFLADVDYPASLLFARFRDQVLAQLPAHSCMTYRGVRYREQWRNILETACQVQPIGQVVWKEGKEQAIPCRAVVFRAQLREEEDDPKEANPEVNLVILFPLVGAKEPLILATSLSVHKLDEFMVRDWAAIERLLWAGAMAYTLLVILYLNAREEGRRFLEEVRQLLQ